MTFSAEVLIADKLSPEEVARLAGDFEAIGLAADLREVLPRRSLSDVAWYVLAALPLQPFLDKLAEDVAGDAYGRFKSVVTRILHRRRISSEGGQRLLVLQDTVTGLQVVLEPELPLEGYQQLLSFDLSTVERGPLHYDRTYRRWRSELDEADKSTHLHGTPDSH